MKDVKLLNYKQAEHKTNKYDVKIAKIRRDEIVAICKYIVLITIKIAKIWRDGIVAICKYIVLITIVLILILVIAVLLYSPPPILL